MRIRPDQIPELLDRDRHPYVAPPTSLFYEPEPAPKPAPEPTRDELPPDGMPVPTINDWLFAVGYVAEKIADRVTERGGDIDHQAVREAACELALDVVVERVFARRAIREEGGAE